MVLGGAALTPRVVNKDCSDVYNGKVIYGRDAFTDLRFMDAFVDARKQGHWDNIKGFLNGIPEGISLGGDFDSSSEERPNDGTPAPASEAAAAVVVTDERSDVVPEEPPLRPEFLGSKVLQGAEQIPLREVIAYLDRQALFAGQWQMRKAKRRWRRFKGKPVRKFRRFVKRYGRAKGKGKGGDAGEEPVKMTAEMWEAEAIKEEAAEEGRVLRRVSVSTSLSVQQLVMRRPRMPGEKGAKVGGGVKDELSAEELANLVLSAEHALL